MERRWGSCSGEAAAAETTRGHHHQRAAQRLPQHGWARAEPPAAAARLRWMPLWSTPPRSFSRMSAKAPTTRLFSQEARRNLEKNGGRKGRRTGGQRRRRRGSSEGAAVSAVEIEEEGVCRSSRRRRRRGREEAGPHCELTSLLRRPLPRSTVKVCAAESWSGARAGGGGSWVSEEERGDEQRDRAAGAAVRWRRRRSRVVVEAGAPA